MNGLEIADMLKGEGISMCGRDQPKTFKQRNEYIHNKMMQLDQVKDAYKHTHRLARIMKYHKLLTDVEVSSVRQKLKQAFQKK